MSRQSLRLETSLTRAPEAADTILADLACAYAGTALSTVHDNVSQARERLDFATTAVTAAQEKLGTGDSGQAAVEIHAALGAMDQSTLLVDAIDRVQAEATQLVVQAEGLQAADPAQALSLAQRAD